MSKDLNYFVDESGDGVLFNRKGEVLFMNDNPKHFILGMIDLKNEELLEEDFNILREKILNDPYFKGVPSFQEKNKKTAFLFHAKDDLPEVRKEVFSIILKYDFKFYAVIKSMKAVFDYVKSRNNMDDSYRYKPDELYDLTVRMLFKNRLHLGDKCNITFAKRGNVSRTEALCRNIEESKNKFLTENPNKIFNNSISINMKNSKDSAGLQCVDYCLWALQRYFERSEDRFLGLIWDKVGLIHDVDDKSKKQYGNYLTNKSDKPNIEYLSMRQI